MTTLGATFRPQLPPERLRSLAQAADESGLDDLWLWEDCFLEGAVSSTAAALAWTRRVRVCVGVLPTPLRNVALTAMETATLERMFPGRVALGIGHGVQTWMGQVGARPASPLTLLREYATALRGLLDGDEVTTTGRYVSLDAVRLEWPPASAPPIWAAGEGPKTLRLTGEVADGTILTGGTTPDDVRRARTLIDQGRAADVGVAGSAEQVADCIGRWVDAGADTVVLQPAGDDPDPEAFMHVVGAQLRPLLA